MKTILMILASSEFRDIEYIVPKAFFEQAGYVVKTASSTPESIGRFGYKVINDYLIKDLSHSEFDAIYFVGGKGSLQYLEDEQAKTLTQSFIEANKIVAAICAAPRNLLHWGLLKGEQGTGHNFDGEIENLYQSSSATYVADKPVVVSNRFVTGNGAEASEECALKFMALLETK